MGKIVALIIIISLLVTALPAFADEGSARREKSLFQIVSDSIEAADDAREKNPWNDITLFENAQEKLSMLGEKSIEAKMLSLRGNEGEIARRRSIR